MHWIAVGLVKDVPNGTVVPRRVDGVDLAIWSSGTGVFHAWDDRCPHRGMRLSHGFVRGESLACIYHGWQYASKGGCEYIPAHPGLTPPKTICAKSYPCEIRDDAIWVAMAPAETDIPDLGARQPIRSMDIALSAKDVAQKLVGAPNHVLFLGDAFDTAIALQPSTDHSCFAHVFAGADQCKKAVSQHVEDLRTQLEAA